MEVAQLARLVILMVAVMTEAGLLADDGDAGHSELVKEIRALTQVYGERIRAQTITPFHETTRGIAALERADKAEETR